jgi:hypothetical protein
MLTDQDIKEFQELYFREYGKNISSDDAHQMASNLLNLVKIVYQEPEKTSEIKMRELGD